MINLHKLIKKIKKTLRWLIINNYGRFVLGAVLAIMGVFSQYGTIDFLTTDWIIFEILSTLGVLLLIGQFLWVIIRTLYLYLTRNQ